MSNQIFFSFFINFIMPHTSSFDFSSRIFFWSLVRCLVFAQTSSMLKKPSCNKEQTSKYWGIFCFLSLKGGEEKYPAFFVYLCWVSSEDWLLFGGVLSFHRFPPWFYSRFARDIPWFYSKRFWGCLSRRLFWKLKRVNHWNQWLFYRHYKKKFAWYLLEFNWKNHRISIFITSTWSWILFWSLGKPIISLK